MRQQTQNFTNRLAPDYFFSKPLFSFNPSFSALGLVLCLFFLFSMGVAKASNTPVKPDRLKAVSSQFFNERNLASLLVQVRVNGEEVFSHAQGQAMPDVPATQQGHFRNGAVAIAYMAATLLKLAEQGVIDLDTPIIKWLPHLPQADKVTPRMLSNMTSGYPDYVADAGFIEAFYDNPFRNWTNEQRIKISTEATRVFQPGKNWDYSHAGYVILAEVMEAATNKTLKQLIQENILEPLELEQTRSIDSPYIPDPVIHAYSAERGIYEDATFWNPSWTLPEGAVQVTTIDEMARSFDTLVGQTGFLSEPMRKQMIAPTLVGFGAPLEGCRSCHTLTRNFYYGLGVFMSRGWVFQSPLFGGYASMVATLPADRSPTGDRITIAVATTAKENAFPDWTEGMQNLSDSLTRLLAVEIVPENGLAPSRHGSD